MYEDHEARRAKFRRFLRGNVVWMAPAALIVGSALFFAFGKLVQWLWLVTLVDIFAIKPITFWQAWGILLLSQLLFKANLRPMTRTGRWRRRSHPGGDMPGMGADPPAAL